MRTSFALPSLPFALLVGVLLIGAGALAPAVGAVSFAPRADYPTETRPQGVAVGVALGVGDGGFGANTGFSVSGWP